MWPFRLSRSNRRSNKNRTNRRRLLRCEALESRQLLASFVGGFSVQLLDDLGNPDPSGNHVEFSGDGSLVLSLQGSYLRHDIPMGGAFESSIDLDPAIGVQSRTMASVTKLTVDGTGANDSFAMATGMSFSSVTSGKAVSISAETVTLNGPLSTGGGKLQSSGVDFTTVTTLSNLVTAGGAVELNHTGVVLLNGLVNAASFTVGSDLDPAQSFTTAAGRTITATAGNVSVYTSGDINLQGDTSATQVGGASITLDSDSGNVFVRRIVTNGGDFASSGVDFTAVTTLSNIVTAGGAVELNHTGVVLLNSLVNAASFTVGSDLDPAQSFTTASARTITATAGNVSIYTVNDISLQGDVSASNSNAGNLTLDSSSGNVSVRRVVTDGGDFTSTGVAFTTTTTQSNIVTAGGGVNLNHAGVVLLNGIVSAGSFTVGSAAERATSFTTAGGKTIAASAGDIRIYTSGNINLQGDISATDGGTATVTLDSMGGSVAVRRLVTDGGKIWSKGVDFTSVTVQSNIVPSGGVVQLDHTGAVVLNGSIVASALNSSGTTFTTQYTSNLQIAGTATISNTASVSFGGVVNAVLTYVTAPSATTTFESTSTLMVDLAGSLPVLKMEGNLIFANQATVFVDASDVDVESPIDPGDSEYDVGWALSASITNNGLVLISTDDNQGEDTVFLAKIIDDEPALSDQTLRLIGYIKGPFNAVCLGACTLRINPTPDPDFGPILQLQKGATIIKQQPLALATLISITGGVNSSDSLTIDYNYGNPLFYAGAGIPTSYDGLGGSGSDSLRLADLFSVTAIQSLTTDFASSSSGTMHVVIVGGQASTITFANLEPITVDMPIQAATFHLSDILGDDVTLSQNAPGTQSTLAGATIEAVTFRTPSVSLEIDGRAGSDKVTVSPYSLSGSLTIKSEDVHFSGTLNTNGGVLTTIGSGNVTSATGANILTNGGAISIGHTGNFHLNGFINGGSLTAASVSDFLVTGSVQVSGPVNVISAADLKIQGPLAVTGSAAATVLTSGAAYDVIVGGLLRTAGGSVTIEGQDLSVGGELDSSGGAITLNSTGTVVVTSYVSGASVTVPGATTFSASGVVESTAGNIAITASNGISAGSVNGSRTGGAVVDLHAGSGNITLAGILKTNSGGAINTSGVDLTNPNGARVDASRSGGITLVHTGNIVLQGQVIGKSFDAAGATFKTTGVGDTITAWAGDVKITVTGADGAGIGIELKDLVTAFYAGAPLANIELKAPNGDVKVQAATTDGGYFKSTGKKFTLAAGKTINLNAGQGNMELTHSDLIDIAGKIDAKTYLVQGGGNLAFRTGAELVLRVVTAAPAEVFTMKGGGNLQFESFSKVTVSNVGGGIPASGDFVVLSVQDGGQLTNAGFTPAFSSPVDAVFADLALDVLKVTI